MLNFLSPPSLLPSTDNIRQTRSRGQDIKVPVWVALNATYGCVKFPSETQKQFPHWLGNISRLKLSHFKLPVAGEADCGRGSKALPEWEFPISVIISAGP